MWIYPGMVVQHSHHRDGPHSIYPHNASPVLRQGLRLEGPTLVTEMVLCVTGGKRAGHLPGVCSCLYTLTWALTPAHLGEITLVLL